jgi:hypothetical protein|uniref:Uncharacterized protein n=1 Tax=viral metagenome TaxID=1070528 RepID=A0A6C0M2P6_9ZZZZ
MDNIFSSRNEENRESVEKLNLDELYEQKKQEDLAKLYTFNRILTRVHDKIKVASRQKNSQQFCWYLVPEMLMGVPNYDKNGCISYIMSKLQENDFIVRYTHPNLLFISWKHYVPNYVRTEIKKKTGTVIDKFGNYVSDADADADAGANANANAVGNADVNTMIFNKKGAATTKKPAGDFKPIASYKPTGNLIYNQDLFKKIEDRI